MSEIGDAHQPSALRIFIVIDRHHPGYSSTSKFGLNGGIF